MKTTPAAALSAACALLSAGVAHSAIYAVVRLETDVVTVMDPKAVETVAGADNLKHAWSVSIQRTLSSDGPQQPGYVRTLNEYDCAARKMRWKSLSAYSRFGDLVMTRDNTDEAWTASAAPSSEADAALRVVCDSSNRWSAIAASSIGQLVLSQMKVWDEAAPLPPLQDVKPLTPVKASVKKKPAAKDKVQSQR